MRNNYWKKTLLVVLLVAPFGIFYYLSKGKHHFQHLEVFGKMPTLTVFDVQTEETATIPHTQPSIQIIEWARDAETKMRNLHEKLSSKKKKFYFISYFPSDTEVRKNTIRNYMERAKGMDENWLFCYDHSAKLEDYLQDFEAIFQARNLPLNVGNVYLLIDEKGDIRGVYNDKQLKNIEEDMRLLHRHWQP